MKVVKIVMAFLESDGSGVTGLTPSLTVVDYNGDTIIDAQDMIEMGNGSYKYEFQAITDIVYFASAYGGETFPFYAHASNADDPHVFISGGGGFTLTDEQIKKLAEELDKLMEDKTNDCEELNKEVKKIIKALKDSKIIQNKSFKEFDKIKNLITKNLISLIKDVDQKREKQIGSIPLNIIDKTLNFSMAEKERNEKIVEDIKNQLVFISENFKERGLEVDDDFMEKLKLDPKEFAALPLTEKEKFYKDKDKMLNSQTDE